MSASALRIATPIERALVVAAISWVALLALLNPIVPNDFWWHMAFGRLIVGEGHIPSVDAFSFTRSGVAWHDQYWLAQVLFFEVHRIGGLGAVIVVNAAAVALAYLLLLRICVRRSQEWGLSIGLFVVAVIPVTMDNWLVRPQSFVLPLFAGYLAILGEHLAGRPARLWLLPPLMVLWVNLHGTFVLGLVLVALVAIGLLLEAHAPPVMALPPEQRATAGALARRLLLWAGVVLGASLVNPHGLAVFSYVVSLFRNDVVNALATEWAPPTIRDGAGAMFFVLVIVCGALAACLPRRLRLSDAVIGIPFLWLALGAGRNVIWFTFVLAPLLVVSVVQLIGPSVRRPARAAARRQRVAAAIVICVSVAALVAGSPWLKARWAPENRAHLVTADTPVDAVDFLRHDAPRPRRLFHSLAHGSYLIWALPDQPVFVDPRLELYPREQWDDYISLGQGRNVDALVSKYQFDALLLDLQQQKALVDVIRSRPDTWIERYHDGSAVYFVAREAARDR